MVRVMTPNKVWHCRLQPATLSSRRIRPTTVMFPLEGEDKFLIELLRCEKMVKRGCVAFLVLCSCVWSNSAYLFVKQVRQPPVKLWAAPHVAAPVVVNAITNVNGAAFAAMSRLIVTCGIGRFAILSRYCLTTSTGAYTAKIGLLDKNALSVLSKLTFVLFQPCLLFTNVCATVASQSSGSAALLLMLAPTFQILVGFLLGKATSLGLYGGKPTMESKQLLACTTFSNSGPLPLTFVDALLRTLPDTSLCTKATGYISLYLLGWSPLFWILGPTILAPVRKDGVVDRKADRDLLLRRIFSPPVLASISGAIVGSIPFLRNTLLNKSGIFRPIFEAMQALGQGYLPVVLLILAGSLMSTDDSKPPVAQPQVAQPGQRSKQKFLELVKPSKPTPIEVFKKMMVEVSANNFCLTKQFLAVYFGKFLLAPVIGFATIGALKRHVPFLSSALSDPILIFVLLLETCMPSAQNLAVILQLQGDRAGAARIARLLLAVYVLGVPAISFWLVKILQATAIVL